MTNFEELLKVLHKNRVDFVLVGGLAAIAHGGATATSDLDIVYDRTTENVACIVQALHPLNISLRGAPSELRFIFDVAAFKNIHHFTLQTTYGAIDLLADIPGFKNYGEILRSSEKFVLFDMEISVLSLDGLIKNKRATARPKDLNQLPELEELKRLKK